MHHCLSIDKLSRDEIMQVIDLASNYYPMIKNNSTIEPILAGKTVMNLFFENSTRTLVSFELAAKRLGATVVNVDIARSSTQKGESILDTIHTLQAMHNDFFVIRHEEDGIVDFVADNVAHHVQVINGGDGKHAHPTQALLDVSTIHHHKQQFEGLKVAIVGDVLHSRVARSLICALNKLAVAEIRVIAPKNLLPNEINELNVNVHHDMEQGLQDLDVVVMLRLQKERMLSDFIRSDDDYFQQYGLTPQRLSLAKPDAIVMHPGPMNRGIEIDPTVADGPQSVILDQVRYGVAARMAVMNLLATATATQ